MSAWRSNYNVWRDSLPEGFQMQQSFCSLLIFFCPFGFFSALRLDFFVSLWFLWLFEKWTRGSFKEWKMMRGEIEPRAATLQPADEPLPSESTHHFLSPLTTSACWRRSRSMPALQSVKVFKFSLDQPLHGSFLPLQLNVPWKASRCVGWWGHRVVPRFKRVR